MKRQGWTDGKTASSPFALPAWQITKSTESDRRFIFVKINRCQHKFLKLPASQTIELDKVLAEYAELKAQAVDLDPVELHDARQAIRPEKELNAVEQLQRAYGDKYRPLAILDSKRKASELLHE